MYNEPFYSAGLRLAYEGAGRLDGKRVLVTGATGLIGSYLVDALALMNREAGTGVRVYAAGRDEAALVRRFPGGGYTYVPYDATKPVALDFEPDVVVHAATSAHPLAYSTDPVGTMLANLYGAANLLEALRAQGHGRFLMLSTGEIYGENPTLESGFSEADHGWVDTMTPRACYPESKRAAEALCASYRAQYGVNALVARLCHVYGPTFTPSNSRADAQFIRKALAREDIVLKSPGSQVRSFCYVSDAARAIFTLLEKGEGGAAYNVANRHSVASIRQYAETLAAIAGVNLAFDLPPERERAGYTRVTRAVLDPARLESLGWRPRYDLREGLEETYRACVR